MKWRSGDKVEVSGDTDEKGWEGSWWTGVVVKPEKKRMVTVRYDEMLMEDGKAKLVESVGPLRVRPTCEDDSFSVLLSLRWPGDAIDCWHEDGWWEGFVHRVYDDHITVHFPSSSEEYDDIYPPKRPKPDPEAHRVRTGLHWNISTSSWIECAKQTFRGAGNFRKSAPPAAALTLVAGCKTQESGGSSSSGDDDVEPLTFHRPGNAGLAQKQQQQQQRTAPLPAPPADASSQQWQQAAAGSDSTRSKEDVPLVDRGAGLQQEVPGAAKFGAIIAQQKAKGAQPVQPQQQAKGVPGPELLVQQWRQQAKGAKRPSSSKQAAQQAAWQGPAASGAASLSATANVEATVHVSVQKAKVAMAAVVVQAQPAAAAKLAAASPAAAAPESPSAVTAAAVAAAAAAPEAAKPAAAPAAGAAAAVAAKERSLSGTPAEHVADLLRNLDHGEAAAPAAPVEAQAVSQPSCPQALAAVVAVAPDAAPLPTASATPVQPTPSSLAPSATLLAAEAEALAAERAVHTPGARQQQPKPKKAAEKQHLRKRDATQQHVQAQAPNPKKNAVEVQPALLQAVEQLFSEAPEKQQQRKQDAQQQQPTNKHNAPIAALFGSVSAIPAAAAVAEGRAPAAKSNSEETGKQQLRHRGSTKLDRHTATSGGRGLFVIPQRIKSGLGAGMGESPDLPLPSPHSATAAAAAEQQPDQIQRQVGDRGVVPGATVAYPAPGSFSAASSAGVSRKRGWEEAADTATAAWPARSPRSAMAPAIPKVQQQQQQQDQWDYDPDVSTILCLDNLPASISSMALEEALGGLGLKGLKSVKVASVPLDKGDRMGGYAVLRFTTPAWAHRQSERLQNLCILTPACPVARPLLLQEPRVRVGYGWGEEERLPGHLSLDFTANQYFSQPNSIEFDMALDWRRLLGVLGAAQQALCREQADELARLLATYVKESGQPEPQLDLQHLLLPGEEIEGASREATSKANSGRWHKGSGNGAAAATAACQETACVWLSGVPVAVGEEALMEAFSHFGFPQQAYVVHDLVTDRPSSHAVLWMESEQRARDLVENLRDMVYILNATPRAVEATMAMPGPPRGSQSTYDRALRCVLGADDSLLEGDIEFVEVGDELVMDKDVKPEQRATIALRRLLKLHRKEQDHLEGEKRKRLRELDERHSRQLDDERFKLGRLAQMQLEPGPDGQPLLQYLMERHGMQARMYGDKDVVHLAQLAAVEKRKREAEKAAAEHAAPAAAVTQLGAGRGGAQQQRQQQQQQRRGKPAGA